jgi:site-specific DNA recombinase
MSDGGATSHRRSRRPAEQEAHLTAHTRRHEETAALVTGMQQFCQRMSHGLAAATFEQKRQLVELLIDRVAVTGEQVEIRYVIPTAPAGAQGRFCHLRTDYFHRPQLHLRLGKRRGHLLGEGSAWTCRWRGT